MMMEHSKTILLVEDDFLNRRLTKKILMDYDYVILEAKNSLEALEHLKKEEVDLAIIDINLNEKELDGIQLAKQINEKYPIPFIFLTAYDTNEIINKAISTSPYSYLTKPFKNIDLTTAVGLAIMQSENSLKHKPSILVKDGEYTVELLFEDILYIESIGNYLHFYTKEYSYKIRSTIKQLLEVLPKNFMQVHRAFVVNSKKVEKSNSKCLLIKNIEIPISKSYFQKNP